MYLHCQDSISYPHSHDYTMADGKPAQFKLYIHIHVHVVPPFNDKDYISNKQYPTIHDQNFWRLTLTTLAGGTADSLLTPTSCLIGALGVLDHEIYTWTTCNHVPLPLMINKYIFTYLIWEPTTSIFQNNSNRDILTRLDNWWWYGKVRILESSVWSAMSTNIMLYNLWLLWSTHDLTTMLYI